jgi:hypothetical protein
MAQHMWAIKGPSIMPSPAPVRQASTAAIGGPLLHAIWVRLCLQLTLDNGMHAAMVTVVFVN